MRRCCFETAYRRGDAGTADWDGAGRQRAARQAEADAKEAARLEADRLARHKRHERLVEASAVLGTDAVAWIETPQTRLAGQRPVELAQAGDRNSAGRSTRSSGRLVAEWQSANRSKLTGSFGRSWTGRSRRSLVTRPSLFLHPRTRSSVERGPSTTVSAARPCKNASISPGKHSGLAGEPAVQGVHGDSQWRESSQRRAPPDPRSIQSHWDIAAYMQQALWSALAANGAAKQ